MAFLDNLSAVAKSLKDTAASAAKAAGNTANRSIEAGKLNSRIKSENANIAQFKNQIGDILWAEYQEGAVTDPRIVALCESIGSSTAKIAELQEQLEALAQEGESQKEDFKAMLAEQKETLSRTMAKPEPVLDRHCSKCGAVNPADARFCSCCGAVIEEEPEQAPAEEAPETPED